MTFLTIMGALATLSAGFAAWLFRKGGQYNPTNPEITDFSKPVSTDGGTIVPSKPQISPTAIPAQDKVYNAAKALLGHSLTDNVDPSVGCAESVSNVLIKAGYNNPKIPSVNGIITWCSANFQEVLIPQYGCVITAHNVDPSVRTGSHCGIVLKFGIASNTSANGLFQENYHLSSWRTSFGLQGSKTRYFLPI